MTAFKRTQRDYPPFFKIAVVEPVEKGEMTCKQASTAIWHSGALHRACLAA